MISVCEHNHIKQINEFKGGCSPRSHLHPPSTNLFIGGFMKVILDVKQKVDENGKRMVIIEVLENDTTYTSKIFIKSSYENRSDQLVYNLKVMEGMSSSGKFFVDNEDAIDKLINQIKCLYMDAAWNKERKVEIEI
jgi:hypothetical protein